MGFTLERTYFDEVPKIAQAEKDYLKVWLRIRSEATRIP